MARYLWSAVLVLSRMSDATVQMLCERDLIWNTFFASQQRNICLPVSSFIKLGPTSKSLFKKNFFIRVFFLQEHRIYFLQSSNHPFAHVIKYCSLKCVTVLSQYTLYTLPVNVLVSAHSFCPEHFFCIVSDTTKKCSKCSPGTEKCTYYYMIKYVMNILFLSEYILIWILLNMH